MKGNKYNYAVEFRKRSIDTEHMDDLSNQINEWCVDHPEDEIIHCKDMGPKAILCIFKRRDTEVSLESQTDVYNNELTIDFDSVFGDLKY